MQAMPTGAQQGSVAIIRLSGPEAVAIASAVFRPSRRKASWVPKTHRIYHGHVLDADGSIVDEVPSSCIACSDANFDAFWLMAHKIGSVCEPVSHSLMAM